jgi:hypothetical protein
MDLIANNDIHSVETRAIWLKLYDISNDMYLSLIIEENSLLEGD